jgi:hypothetical protein
MEQLIAKNLKDAKFSHPKGYFMTKGFGVYNVDRNAWLTFDGEFPYRPQGGRKAAVEVVETVNCENLQWIPQIN